MQESEQQQANPGGAAPEHRQCHYLLSNGATCRRWAVLGHQHCHSHRRYLNARPERPIDVPLLEDEGSLTYVLSQTVQALAWGTLPTANGHTILAACRLVQNNLTTRLETAKLRFKVRRLGIPEHEIFDEPAPEPVLSRGACSRFRTPSPPPTPLRSRPKTSASATSRRTGTRACSAPKMRWATCTSSVSAKARKTSRPPAPLPSSTSPRRTVKSSAPAPWPKRKPRPVHQPANPRGIHRPALVTESITSRGMHPLKSLFRKEQNEEGPHPHFDSKLPAPG